MSIHCTQLLAVLLLTLTSVNGLRVLGLFPHPGLSHFHFFHPIMRELAIQGHNVTVVSHFPDANPPANYKDLQLTGMDLMSNSVSLDVSRNDFGSKVHYYSQTFIRLKY